MSTKEERSKRLREWRTTLVTTWIICFVMGMIAGAFVSAIVRQIRNAKDVESEPVETVVSAPMETEPPKVEVQINVWSAEISRTAEIVDSGAAVEVREVELEAEPETETEAAEMVVSAPPEEPKPESRWIKVLATAYCDSKNAVPTGCINDLPLTDEWSVAAVLDFFPYGTLIEIEGIGVRKVEDTAGKATIEARLKEAKDRECETWIDVFIADKSQVREFGVRELRVRVVE